MREAGSTPEPQAFYAARVSENYASVDEPSWDDPSKALPLVLAAVRNYEQRLKVDPNDINSKYSLAVNNSKIGYYLRESDPAQAVRALDHNNRPSSCAGPETSRPPPTCWSGRAVSGKPTNPRRRM